MLITFSLCVIVVVASLVLGGGTRGGFLSDAILQLIAIPLLFASLWRLLQVPLTSQMRIGLFLCTAIAAVPLIQLIPLPPWLWTALPGREPVIEAFELLGQELPWMPISLRPNETWLSALSLIPPIAIFLSTLLLGYQERRWLTLVLLAVAVSSAFIGLLQVAQGPESPWRFFEITNPTEAVGFFANRNHFAALLYAMLLFAAGWTVHVGSRIRERHSGESYDTASIVVMIGTFLLFVILLAGEAMARSRMGLGLTIVALIGAGALGASYRRVAGVDTPIKIIIGAGVLVLIFSAPFALYRIMERFVVDPLQEARLAFTRNTIDAALAFMPLGSGLGTFVPVYTMFEQPKDLLLDRYANHAHNDFAELWLTTGVMGPVIFGMFIVWFCLRSVEIWRSPPATGASELDWSLARAATIIVALLIVHSVFDYPLRTGAMMAVLAFACALLIEPTALAASWNVSEVGASLKKALHVVTGNLAPALSRALPPALSRALPPAFSRTLRHRSSAPQPSALREPTSTPPLAGLVTSQSVPQEAASPATAKPTSVSQTSAGSLGTLPAERRWGTDIEWPQEWSKSSKERAAPETSQEPPRANFKDQS